LGALPGWRIKVVACWTLPCRQEGEAAFEPGVIRSSFSLLSRRPSDLKGYAMSAPGDLPSNPGLRQLRDQARDLGRAVSVGDAAAVRRIADSHPRFTGTSESEVAALEESLSDAQPVVAREMGFDS
jgi:hypothetical protein